MEQRLIKLINETYQTDSIGQRIPVETSRNVWSHLSSISRAEFSAAGRNGLNPQIMAVTHYSNYNGEKIAEVDGKRYGIYRTYRDSTGDSIEIYMESKTGV